MEEGGSWLSFEDIYCVIVDNIGMVFNFVNVNNYNFFVNVIIRLVYLNYIFVRY